MRPLIEADGPPLFVSTACNSTEPARPWLLRIVLGYRRAANRNAPSESVRPSPPPLHRRPLWTANSARADDAPTRRSLLPCRVQYNLL